MSDNLIAALGLSKDELQERVLERAVAQLFETSELDEDGYSITEKSPFAGRLEKAMKKAIDDRVALIAEKHVLPKVGEMVENLVLTSTNEWGEKRGEKLTFTEYLVKRADAYLQEKVNFDGKDKAEANGYSWSGTQTRITHLVHKHLHYSIETAMKAAVQNVNSVIAPALAETAKLKLGEIAAGLKVQVTTK